MAWKIFEDIGEFFTGDQAKAAEAKRSEQEKLAMQQAQGAAQGVSDVTQRSITSADQANKEAARYGSQVASDMGGSTAEYMRKANQAASNQAGQAGQAAAKGASRAALQAARTAGINKGQAALTGAQQAGDSYTNAYQGGLESGRQQYQSGVAQRQGAANDAYGRGERATQTAGALQSGMYNTSLGAAMGSNQAGAQQAQQSGAQGGGLLSGITSAVGTLFSDERLKDDVSASGASIEDLINKAKGIGRIEKLAETVDPVDFNYKPESGEDPNKRNVGVMAQDIEQTDMADNVMDTPKGKTVDIGKQTMSNLNYIVELSRVVTQLYDELQQLKGAK